MLNIFHRRVNDKRMILSTLAVSHYVEKVRWCMDRLQIPYEEEKNIGILNILILGRMVSTEALLLIQKPTSIMTGFAQ